MLRLFGETVRHAVDIDVVMAATECDVSLREMAEQTEHNGQEQCGYANAHRDRAFLWMALGAAIKERPEQQQQLRDQGHKQAQSLREILQELIGWQKVPFGFDAFRRDERIGFLAQLDGPDRK